MKAHLRERKPPRSLPNLLPPEEGSKAFLSYRIYRLDNFKATPVPGLPSLPSPELVPIRCQSMVWNRPLSYLQKSLDRALLLCNFKREIRSSGVTTSTTIIRHIRNSTECCRLSFDSDSFQNTEEVYYRKTRLS